MNNSRMMSMTGQMSPQYYNILFEIMEHGVTSTNKRTGVKVKTLRHPWSFILNLSNWQLPVPGNRRFWPHIAAAEVAWQVKGTQDPNFIMQHAPKIWGKFIDEDGTLLTAYGYRWREHFGRDQLQEAIDALRKDPTNRQVYIAAWDPGFDGLDTPNQPMNIPCPVGFSVTVIGDKVHLAVHIRSSDVFVGLPYDVMGYAYMLFAFASSLEVEPGSLHVTLANAHIYEPHFGDAYASIDSKRTWIADHEPAVSPFDFAMIEATPGNYVDRMKELANKVNKHTWNPTPEVIV